VQLAVALLDRSQVLLEHIDGTRLSRAHTSGEL
jgi:hypothetical protein